MINKYEIAYDMILDIQQEIIPEITNKTGLMDSRSVNVLSAAYILQDFLADRIAAIGESPWGEAEDGITWERIKEVLEGYGEERG